MKQRFFIFIFFALLFPLLSCKSHILLSDITASEYVQLTDYTHIEIPQSLTEISESDIESIISWDFASSDSFIPVTDRETVQSGDVVYLSISYDDIQPFKYYYEAGTDDIFLDINIFIDRKVKDILNTNLNLSDKTVEASTEILGIYRYPTLSDETFILSYYGYSTMGETIEFIKNRACNEIVYHYMWDYIVSNSKIIDYPPFVKNKTDFPDSNITVSEDDIYSYYDDFLIGKAILEKENIDVSSFDIQNIISKKSAKLNIEAKDIYLYCDKDDLYYDAVMQLLKENLTPLAKIISD